MAAPPAEIPPPLVRPTRASVNKTRASVIERPEAPGIAAETAELWEIEEITVPTPGPATGAPIGVEMPAIAGALTVVAVTAAVIVPAAATVPASIVGAAPTAAEVATA
jgi:hypothetical protein